MLSELTNLLPSERKHTLRREYLLRLSTVALTIAGLILLAHIAQLWPTYSFVEQERLIQEERVVELSERREVSGFSNISERVTAFSKRAETLEELPSLLTASEAVRAVLGLPREGIMLTSFVVATSDGGQMRLSGTASTRESLRAFDRALGELPFVRSTDLPLSAYARESDIPFEIALIFTTP